MLHCETEPQIADADWLREGTLASLRELNEECLELCAAQGRAPGGHATLAEIARQWRALDTPARARASDCLYLLADAGFACAERWRGGASQVDEAAPGYAPFFTLPATATVAQAVFTFAWHLARSQPAAARLLLCMPAASVADLAQHTLGQVRALALHHPHWLQPRWAHSPAMWHELLSAAAAADGGRLERARLRGQRLLAAQLRAGTSRIGCGAASAARSNDHGGF
jgi:hypothetical protein